MSKRSINIKGYCSIGLGEELDIQVADVPEIRFKSILIGMKTDEYLIVKTPLMPPDKSFGINTKVIKGNELIIRYIHEGVIFGFRSKIIGRISDPKRLIFVEYPSVVERHELRSQKRVECILPVEILCGNAKNQGTIVDLSIGGCCCSVKQAVVGKEVGLKAGDAVNIMAQFPGVEGQKEMSGIVKNVKGNIDELLLGIVFDDLDVGISEIVNEYISAVDNES